MTKDNGLDVCIRCSVPPLNEESDFCHNCGLPLNSNYCTNNQCYVYNNEQSIPLPDNACYCDACGSETTYFKEGIIKPIVY